MHIQDLCKQEHISKVKLSHWSELDIKTIGRAFKGLPIHPKKARSIRQALSQHLGREVEIDLVEYVWKKTPVPAKATDKGQQQQHQQQTKGTGGGEP